MIRLLTFDSFRHYDILAKIHSNLTTAVLFSKKRHILMRIRQGLLLHHFFSPKATKRRLKKRHILISAVSFSTKGLWTQHFTKKLSLRSFRSKYCTIKDCAQTYDFIADKSCLLFSIILKVLSLWEVIRTQGKCVESYKNFWKDFVVEQNLTRPKGDFWSYLNRPYEIVGWFSNRINGNVSWRRESARKGLNKTSDAQFVALPLVKLVV